MAGSMDVVSASTLEELEESVAQWYERAADAGLEDARISWDPDLAYKTEDGYEFAVWAHS
jgi:hypothetical protein